MSNKRQIIDTVIHIFEVVKSAFLSGLFTIIPIGATIFFINFTYNFMWRLLQPLRNLEPVWLQEIPGSEFILVMILILALGIILKAFLVHRIVHYSEELISRIPLVRIVYTSAKILVDFFKMSDKKKTASQKVVLITYPKKGQYHLAFLLEPADESYEKLLPVDKRAYPEQKFYKVFMPNSPNPTSGYFFVMAEEDIIHTNITFEEAIKVIVSCGLVTPESLKQ